MASESIPAEQGSLERLGIATETQIPENILTPSNVAAVRFRQQRERGYYTKDVETFVKDQVKITLEWFAQRLHARDLDVHVLGGELDRAEVDIANLRAQLQVSEATAPFQDIIAQAQQDPEIEAMMARMNQDLDDARARTASLEREVERLSASNADLVNYSEEQDRYIDAVETRIRELESAQHGATGAHVATSEELHPEEAPEESETVPLDADHYHEAPEGHAGTASWQGDSLPSGLRPEDFE